MNLAFASPVLALRSSPAFLRPISKSHRRPSIRRVTTALLGADGGPAAYYREQEGLDDADESASMAMWNSVIHASLKRKLEGFVAENPVVSGVSALMHASPGYASPGETCPSPNMPQNLSPELLVSHILNTFIEDALAGATAFIQYASPSNYVGLSTPQGVVLFAGDNESYRPLLHIQSFKCDPPKFEKSGSKCVVRAYLQSAQEAFTFDFQLSSADGTSWLVDELFRL